MNTLLFENFLVLAETLNYTKAADVLFKSESVLSRQISKLENILGCKLFLRNNRIVSLTPAGKRFYEGLAKLSKDYLHMIDEMNAIKNGHSGLIKIALSPGVRLHDNLVKIIMCFEKDYPDIHIDLQSHNMGELQNLLLNQQVDFVHSVVTDFSGIPFIASHFIGTSRNYLIVPKDHPAANKKIEDLSLCDFKDDTFLFYTDQIQAIKSFSRRCESFGFSLKYKTVSCASMMTLSFELRRGIMLSEETNMHKASADMVILPLPELGCIELGIMHNTKNKKECNATFINYIQIANANQGNYSSGGYLR